MTVGGRGGGVGTGAGGTRKGGGERGEEEREGARQARHFGPIGPSTLGSTSPSL